MTLYRFLLTVRLAVPPLTRPVSAARALDAASVALVRNGRKLPVDDRWQGDGPWAVLDEAGELVAVYGRVDAHTVKPDVVIPTA